MDFEEMANTNMNNGKKRWILEAAILHHDEFHNAVTSAKLFEETFLTMATTSAFQKMGFDAFYDYVRAQALIVGRNYKEKKTINDKTNENGKGTA